MQIIQKGLDRQQQIHLQELLRELNELRHKMLRIVPDNTIVLSIDNVLSLFKIYQLFTNHS